MAYPGLKIDGLRYCLDIIGNDLQCGDEVHNIIQDIRHSRQDHAQTGNQFGNHQTNYFHNSWHRYWHEGVFERSSAFY